MPLMLIVAMSVSETNYGKEATVVPPKDLVEAIGAVNAQAISTHHEVGVEGGLVEEENKEKGGESDVEVAAFLSQ
jgi:hypothetical protein